MNAPRIEIDLGKIRQNARFLVRRLGARGISVTGVTKAVCGHPGIAKAMLEGGVRDLADARIGNVLRMRAAGVGCAIAMIRAPMAREIHDVVKHCDASYNTEIGTILKLAEAARTQGKEHQIVLMVEMGDMREGLLPETLVDVAACVVATPGVALMGIAANFACLGKAAPTADDMIMLSCLADQVEGACGPYVGMVSGGGSANLSWALGQGATGRINTLRLGEAILLGTDPISGCPIDGLHTDAFALFAEVIETRLKSGPLPMRRSAWANPPLELVSREDARSRSILAIGRQDTDTNGLRFPSGVGYIGATSDHSVIDTTKAPVRLGSEIKMGMNYSALMRAMNATDVEKTIHGMQGRGQLARSSAPLSRLSLV